MRFRLLYFAVTIAFLLSLGCTLERTAYAYVDPGSSLLVYQSVSAVITGTLFYFRGRIKAFFGRASNGSASTRPGK